MKLSDIIEQYIQQVFAEENTVELKRSELATMFNCVPSQINYVISTRFIPELGFYVESRRGGGGYIKISRIDLSKTDYLYDILDKIDDKLSQSVVDIYLKDFIRYNMLDEKAANLIRVALSDKSLIRVDKQKRDRVRADIFKCLIVNLD
ncbi:MAG: CtsR family transcriptional regulator [Clostridia bacterium]